MQFMQFMQLLQPIQLLQLINNAVYKYIYLPVCRHVPSGGKPVIRAGDAGPWSTGVQVSQIPASLEVSACIIYDYA